RDAGVIVRDVADVTVFPEMLDGRVKTLHPKIHGGILARRDVPAHREALERHGIPPIDLVVVALYPFEATVARPGVTLPEAIEPMARSVLRTLRMPPPPWTLRRSRRSSFSGSSR